MNTSLARLPVALAALLLASAAAQAAPGTFTPFSDIPMFGLYATDAPPYTPPAGVLMKNNGTRYITKLTSAQRALIGSDLKARITYHAQCDNYDRLGAMFLIVKRPGEDPLDTDPIVEVARWVTPFSDFWQGAKATYTFPEADLAPFSGLMRNRNVDVWLGIDGGSNPYTGDPCTNKDVTPEFRVVGFRYTVDLVSTQPGKASKGLPSMPVPMSDYTSVPVAGSATSKRTGGGTAVVIVSGHGSASGGDEYKHTVDTLTVNGAAVGSFSTQAMCAAYRKYSPDGNPFIFLNNGGSNPRNWCPGALIPAHSFRVTLGAENTVSLDMDDPRVPDGSYYRTSITLLPD
ncbi:peptide-N-glycosidase F-related protein [Ideonella sp. DXS29W]|uniref:Peptide-N-glycosidase F-related protein n=1 Tax=Ideonella lacteola TaxID=2984193 RepID=A0ABU9BMW8_9BURK